MRAASAGADPGPNGVGEGLKPRNRRAVCVPQCSGLRRDTASTTPIESQRPFVERLGMVLATPLGSTDWHEMGRGWGVSFAAAGARRPCVLQPRCW